MRTLIIVVIVAIAGYFIYQEMFDGGGDAPTCKQAFDACRKKCRATETETAPYNACLKKCQDAQDACR